MTAYCISHMLVGVMTAIPKQWPFTIEKHIVTPTEHL